MYRPNLKKKKRHNDVIVLTILSSVSSLGWFPLNIPTPVMRTRFEQISVTKVLESCLGKEFLISCCVASRDSRVKSVLGFNYR